MFEEEINSPLKGEVEKQLVKKRSNPFSSAIIKFLLPKNFSKKTYVIENVS
jgi:hypothetical protein